MAKEPDATPCRRICVSQRRRAGRESRDPSPRTERVASLERSARPDVERGPIVPPSGSKERHLRAGRHRDPWTHGGHRSTSSGTRGEPRSREAESTRTPKARARDQTSPCTRHAPACFAPTATERTYDPAREREARGRARTSVVVPVGSGRRPARAVSRRCAGTRRSQERSDRPPSGPSRQRVRARSRRPRRSTRGNGPTARASKRNETNGNASAMETRRGVGAASTRSVGSNTSTTTLHVSPTSRF